MATQIKVKITPQGLLIPRTALGDWLEQGELEVVKAEKQIIIQPKSTPLTEREQVWQILEQAGLLTPVEPLPPDHVPLSPEEKKGLARKLSQGRPLSEVIMEERARGW